MSREDPRRQPKTTKYPPTNQRGQKLDFGEQVLWRHLVAGKSYREAARLMNLTERSAMGRALRTRRRFGVGDNQEMFKLIKERKLLGD